MFTEILGLPAHPLLVHAAVVFAPLLVIGVVAYCLAPAIRPKIGWSVLALALVAPAALWFAKLSGDQLRLMLIEKHYPEQILAQVNQHRTFGTAAAWAGSALGLVTLVLVLVGTAAGKKPATRGSRTLTYTLVVIALVLAAATGYYVFKTGDSGARAVWGTF